MRVTEAVAATLAGLGADTVFGVVGSEAMVMISGVLSTLTLPAAEVWVAV